ncbi:DNA polymerase I [bacterium Unc6]|nr:DNA polymerase I [bacterium Unc6]
MKIVLIDGNNLCYKAYYAIHNLSTSSGMPTNAIYGMFITLRKLISEGKPDAIAVCMDSKGPTLRQEQFVFYKKSRKPIPADLLKQMPYIKKMMELLGIKTIEMKGYEADDIIGSLTKKAVCYGLDVEIISSDKDLLQLVGENVLVRKEQEKPPMDEQAVREVYGISPSLIPDYLALVGDRIDDIPGVPGIGPKAAKELILGYGTIENILSNVENIPNPRVKQALNNFKEQAIISKQLTHLIDIDIDFNIHEFLLKEQKKGELLEFLRQMEFRTFLTEYSNKNNKEIFFQKVKTQDIAKDVEEILSCAGVSVMFSEKIGCAFSIPSSKTFFFEITDIDLCLKIFNSHLPKYGYNFKDIIKFLMDKNANIQNIAGDLLIETHLLRGNRGAPGVNEIAAEYLLENPVSCSEQWEKICYCADAISRVHKKIRKLIKEEGMERLLLDIEIPLTLTLARAEKAGVCLDTELLTGLGKNIEDRINKIKIQMCEEAGIDFNPNSPKQVSDVLFNRLKLPAKKKTKTGYSTDAQVLLELSENTPFVRTLLEYRQTKIYSTYIEQLSSSRNTSTGCIHTLLSQTDTATGRLSSSEPNLQNIPIKTEVGRQIRRCFIPKSQNRCFISADYSQVELRVLAHFSKDENLISAFSQGLDIHCATAKLIYGTNKINDSMRSFAKTINFGIIYGISPYGLSKELKISVEEAEGFISAYFEKYSGVRNYINNFIKCAYTDGFVRTLFGRKRFIPELKNSEQQIRQLGERIAINTPLQGSAAEIIKIAMIKLDSHLQKERLGASIVLQVHDELLLDAPQDIAKDVCRAVKNIMENAVNISVPLRADVKVGKNWLEMQTV